MGEGFGVLIAVVSSCLGGTAAAVTRYLVGNADPVTLAILRWSIGFLFLLPAAVLLQAKWPGRSDWLAVSCLGLCFFGLFFLLYNIALAYTTAARASLAPSTLPLQTMVVGAALGIEPLSARKLAGVGLAMIGVFAALATGLSGAPSGAWIGELLMTGAVLCMAFYNVLSRTFIQRSSPLGFLTRSEWARVPRRSFCSAWRRGVLPFSARSARRNGLPASTWGSRAERSPSSYGSWRFSALRRRASPTP